VRGGSRRGARDRGAAAVEFAIVLPLLLMLVFGIIDFGRMASASVQLSAAARAAAQAYVLGGDPTKAANDVFLQGTIEVDPVSQCPPNPDANATASVKLTYKYKYITPVAVLAGITGDPTLTATGVVPCRA
jgi:type II secretory pathway pseudopilin PulG